MQSSKSQVWGGHLSQQPAEANVLFCAGRDVQTVPMADVALLPYDIWTNRAHAIMWYEAEVLPKETLRRILEGLQQLEEAVEAGQFVLDPQREDVHINVEAFVTERQGAEVGGWMHIGRSRNDQAACDTRLYLRDALLRLGTNIQQLAAKILSHAELHTESVMPGFTHYQPGMITTWGHWLCSYAQALLRDLERVVFALGLVDRNPLGAAAAFGTSWSPNRERTTKLLGFDALERNSLDCITARSELEAQVAQVYSALMNHCSLIAQDLIFLSHPYVAMLGINDAFVTGSSIMPQKKNPDFAEVIKGKTAVVHGALQALLSVPKGMISGYNRDSQVSKYLVMDVIRECEGAPEILSGVFSSLEVFTDKMRARCNEGFMNAVDVADMLAREHQIPFRQGYHIVARAVKHAAPATLITQDALQKALDEEELSPVLSAEVFRRLQAPLLLVSQRKHVGGPAPAQVQQHIRAMSSELSQQRQFLQNRQKRIQAAANACREYRERLPD
jgi:argininosuccinate lyase